MTFKDTFNDSIYNINESSSKTLKIENEEETLVIEKDNVFKTVRFSLGDISAELSVEDIKKLIKFLK